MSEKEKYIIDGTKLKAIADAVRSKTGETGSLTAAQMAEKITNIQTGDTALTKMLLSGEGGISTLDTTSLKLDTYRPYAFSEIYGIYSVKDDNIYSIGFYAFSGCGNLGESPAVHSKTAGKVGNPPSCHRGHGGLIGRSFGR